jgi:hypothetical protein
MGKVSFLAAQVPATPTYNWNFADTNIGLMDVGWVSTDAPGPGPAATGLQNIATSVLPRAIYEPQLGQVRAGVENTLGAGEFIYLAVPLSTAVPLGTIVQYSSSTSPSPYQVAAVAATARAAAVAVCVASTSYNSGNGITSNASQIQYAWFQCGGNCQVLKTAIQVVPGSNILTISATNGRVYLTASTGKQILGSRQANTATTTATASCVLINLNGRPVIG